MAKSVRVGVGAGVALPLVLVFLSSIKGEGSQHSSAALHHGPQGHRQEQAHQDAHSHGHGIVVGTEPVYTHYGLGPDWDVQWGSDNTMMVTHQRTGIIVLETQDTWVSVGMASELQKPVSGEGGFTLLEQVWRRTSGMEVTSVDCPLCDIEDSEAEASWVVQGWLTGAGFSSGELPFVFNLTMANAATNNQLRFSLDVDTSEGSTGTSILGTPNRLFFTHASGTSEQVLGFGTQYSAWDMKGRYVPILSTEQGIGRGLQPITAALNSFGGGSGGDWHTTYAPLPAYLTPGGRALMLENTEISAFDLKAADDRIDIELWGMSMDGHIMAADSLLPLITEVTEVTGRMAPLPEWVQKGAIVGLEGGTEVVTNLTNVLLDAGVPITAIWLQDWTGLDSLPEGDRLWWNWEADDGVNGTYHDWGDFVDGLFKDHGIRTMTYINPYFTDASAKENGYKHNYFEEAVTNGYFVMNSSRLPYLLQSTSIEFGTLDVSNPAARTWAKSIIKDNMLAPSGGGGVSGWMNDFGEYIPFDAVMASGEDVATYHNRYPQEWSQLASEAVEEAGLTGEVVFFSRSAALHSPSTAPLFWMGDQLVTWDDKDGIKTALSGMLTGGLTGRTLAHSDIGGYTMVSVGPDGLPWNYQRSKELLLRWIELSAFSDVVFRTHPGLIVDGSPQVYSDDETSSHFGLFARIHSALFDYRQPLIDQASTLGYPVTRPMILHFPDDEVVTADENTGLTEQFMLGDALLVAPVMDQGAEVVSVYLPGNSDTDEWVHVFTNATYPAGAWAEVNAPIGQPGVFVRGGDEQGKAIQEAILKELAASP